MTHSPCAKLIEVFCGQECQQLYLTSRTISIYTNTLKQLARWAATQELPIATLSFEQLKHFLSHQKKVHARSARTQNLNITVLRLFYRYLVRSKVRIDNPAQFLRFIKVAQSRPPTLNVLDIERLLAAPNTLTAQGVRDRAILELLYATGLRIGELVALRLEDIFMGGSQVTAEGNLEHPIAGYLIVRATNSKTKSDRIIPFHAQCAYWLQHYILHIRPHLPNSRRHHHIFINQTASGFLNRHTINRRMKAYAKQARIDSRIYPHLMRHTFATHLLQGNAHLVAISQLLGHTNLSSTQIYTHTSIGHLKKVQQLHHPRSLWPKVD